MHAVQSEIQKHIRGPTVKGRKPGLNMERMWRNGIPSALLVGMQTGAATLENSMEFPQKTKNGTAL